MEHQDYRKVTPETYGRKRYDELRALVGQGKGILMVDRGCKTEYLLVPLPVLGVFTVIEITDKEIEKATGGPILDIVGESVALTVRDNINCSLQYAGTSVDQEIAKAVDWMGLGSQD